MPSAYAPGSAKLRWYGLLIGIGLGGFFDGILLHQILQWHHLLSNVRHSPFARLEVQLLADGGQAGPETCGLSSLASPRVARTETARRLVDRPIAAGDRLPGLVRCVFLKPLMHPGGHHVCKC